MNASDQVVEIWLSAIPDAMLLITPSGEIQYANPAADALFAPNGGVLVGCLVDLLVPALLRKPYVDLRRQFHADVTNSKGQRLVQGCTLDGQTIEVEVHVGLGPGDMAIAIVRDVTNRLKMISDSRVQLAALSATTDAILITDAVGIIKYVNAAFTELTEYTYDEAVGQTPRLLKSDWHGPAFYRSMWETLTGGDVWRGEIVNRRKNGQLYNEEQSITPVMDTAGVITHFIAIKHDVSDRVAAQVALEADLKSAKLLQDLSAIGLQDNPTLPSIASRAAGLIHGQLNLSEMFLAIGDEQGTMVHCQINDAGFEHSKVVHADLSKTLGSMHANYDFAVGIRARKQLLGCLGVRWIDESESEKAILRAVASHLGTMVRQVKLQSEIRRLAETDSLTGLANRRQLFLRGETETKRALRYNRSLSVLLCDLDHFKDVNDTLGHATGDALLREVSDELLNNARNSDIVARYGGEEFVMLLVETDGAGALVFAERVRKRVSKRTVVVNGVSVSITTSIGVACFGGGADSLGDMLKRADKALYTAKRGGRNCSKVAQ